MTSGTSHHAPDHLESVCLYALHALPAGDVPLVEAQISACEDCRQELALLRPVVEAFVDWPIALLRPSMPLWDRLSRRISAETGQAPIVAPPPPPEPEWEEVGPGLFCRVLATEAQDGRVSLLVRLAPGAEYPPHTHAGVEELYMLEGELLVDDKKLRAGDYLRSEPDTADRRVWSETGCMGVLITSGRDVLA